MSEGRDLAESRLTQLERLSDDELLAYQDRVVEEVTAPSGASYRMRIEAGRGSGQTDEDPDLWLQLRVKGKGLRWWQRYTGTIGRFEDADMKRFDDAGVQSVWQESLSAGCVLLFLLALIGPWIVGLVFLVSLLI